MPNTQPEGEGGRVRGAGKTWRYNSTMTNEPIMGRAAELLAQRFDLEPEYTGWAADQLEDAGLAGPGVTADLQLSRLLVTLMATKRPADAVLAVKTFDALPMRWALNVLQGQSEHGAILSEGRVFSTDDLIGVMIEGGDISRATAEAFESAFRPSFTEAVATLIELATYPDLCVSGAMPTTIIVGRNLNAPTASLDHFPTIAGTRMTLGYALEKAPSFPFNVEGLDVTARVDGAIIHDLAHLLVPGPLPVEQARRPRLIA